MNIMLVSVTERTREIGIRRAVGAKKRNIMTQFIIEAIVLCEIGGVIGVVCGILGGNATAWFFKLAPVIPVDWVVLGLLICSVVGIVFGTYPAFKAANLDPIESLRYEMSGATCRLPALFQWRPSTSSPRVPACYKPRHVRKAHHRFSRRR